MVKLKLSLVVEVDWLWNSTKYVLRYKIQIQNTNPNSHLQDKSTHADGRGGAPGLAPSWPAAPTSPAAATAAARGEQGGNWGNRGIIFKSWEIQNKVVRNTKQNG